MPRYRLLISAFLLGLVAMARPHAEDRSQSVDPKVGIVNAAPLGPLDRVKPLVDARRFDEGERLARQILAESISSHGADSLECALALDALIYAQLGETDPSLDELRLNAERAVTIKKARLGEDNLELATSLNNLGKVHLKLGTYETARDSFEQSLRIKEKLLGPHHIDVGKALNNLALVLVRMGEYASARPLYDRVIDIFREAGAREYPELTNVRSNLALLIKNLGDYVPARTMLEQVLKSQETALGTEAPPLGGTLGNLGDLTFKMGDFAASRRYWERVRQLWAKDPGTESSPYAAAMAQLGEILLHTGEVGEGRRLIEQALAIHQKLGLMQSEETATYLNYMAYALALQKDMPGAKDFYQRSLDLMRTKLGDRHPVVSGHRLDLAEHLYRMHEFPAALEQALLSEQIARQNLIDTFPILSERQAIRAESARKPSLDLALTILLETAPGDLSQADITRTWDAIVRSRALVLDGIAARQRESARAPQSPGGASDRLALARREVSRLLVLGRGDRSLAEYEQALKRSVDTREAAERDLAQVNAAYRDTRVSRTAGWPEVMAALPPDTALLSYVRFLRCNKDPAAAPVASYAALMLKSAHGTPRLIPLGSASEIEQAVDAWRKQAGADPRAGSLREREDAYRLAANRLRSLIWDPVWDTRKKPKRIIVVPDAAIHLVSFATLTQANGDYLVDSGPVLHYVAAERDLVLPTRTAKGPGELVIVGGPDFDSPTAGAVSKAALEIRSEPSASTLRSPRAVCMAFGDVRFEPLPQSLAEADDVASLWAASGEVRKLTGLRADEASVKAAAPGARVLHFSTHAFFMGDRCGQTEAATGGDRSAAIAGPKEESAEETLLFSGLALAGANRRHDSESGGEDGILTAEEVSAMDLSGTEWVVLSACETGVGKVLSGEGVLGLRRAFETASSRTLIMSLWQVEDDATRVWMDHLYRNRLDGMSTADSVTQASRQFLDSRRRRGLSTHPFFWGGFVSSGDWR